MLAAPCIPFQAGFILCGNKLAFILVDFFPMQIRKLNFYIFLGLIGLFLVSCNMPVENEKPGNRTPDPVSTIAITTEATGTIAPPSQISICLGNEPSSLFLYGDSSASARLVRQAIYDGPYDTLEGEYSAVILEKIPLAADGNVFFEQMEIQAGSVLVDAWGNLVKLDEGVSYFPTGCQDFSCVQDYSGQELILVDQQVVRFTLKEGVTWSDEAPLSADDSLYSYEVAQALYPRVGSESLPFTQSYQVVDPKTVEWRGMPGYQSGDYLRFFFQPLPRHAWGALTISELQTADISNRWPMGWGAFIVENWSAGEEIVLIKNPNYFRAAEDLPAVDQLVFRFYKEAGEALEGLKAGQCDLLDSSLQFQGLTEELRLLEGTGELKFIHYPNLEWEHIDFGINSLSPDLPKTLELKETRQAIALCIDHQRIVSELELVSPELSFSFLPAAHPLYSSGDSSLSFDTQAASSLLDSIGWLDVDSNPGTARISQGVPGVEDGTEFILEWLTTPDEEQQVIARLAQESLSTCGIQLDIKALPAEELFHPGPEGQIFGRKFQLAEFAWASNSWSGNSLNTCRLYSSLEIPGAYPEYPKGWGGEPGWLQQPGI